MIEVTCDCCGIKYTMHKCHDRNKTRCCSRACADKVKYRKPLVILTAECKHCCVVFTRTKQRAVDMEYCSMECFRAHRTLCKEEAAAFLNRKKRVPRPPDAKWRPSGCNKIVTQLKRERGCCERCGSTRMLQGRHIKPYSLYPELAMEPTNIEILCDKCHAEEHPDMAHMIVYPAQRKGVFHNCVKCGSTYYVTLCKAGMSQFCSSICRGMGRLQDGRQHHPFVSVKCCVCGVVIEGRPSATLKRKCCSLRCTGMLTARILAERRAHGRPLVRRPCKSKTQLAFCGITQSLSDWSVSTGLPCKLLSARYRENPSPESVLRACGTRRSRAITVDDVTHSVAEWSRVLGISINTLRSRLRSGFNSERFVLPVRSSSP